MNHDATAELVERIARICRAEGIAQVEVGIISMTMAPAALIPPALMDDPEEDERDHSYDATGAEPVDLRQLRKEQERG